tara:strand:- start:1453 stop:1845 length:393 start_codon:yes stop_codon:yes gene_type:complete
VLAQAGQVVEAWRLSMSTPLPPQLDDAIQALKCAIEDMNAEARSRVLDPETSRQGPTPLTMNKTRQVVLDVLRVRPLTDTELVAALRGRMSDSGARTRRAELVRMGKVRDSGRRLRSPSGRMNVVWAVNA